MFYLFCSIIILLLYFYSIRNFNYWRKKGVKHDKPIPFFGNASRVFFQKKSCSQLFCEMYWKYPKERYVGLYMANDMNLVIRDPSLIKSVLVSDFTHFTSRGFNRDLDAVEPMMKNLFNADGDLWKLLRQRMTPAFTSGKLKAMFPLIVERAERLQRIAEQEAITKSEVNVRDLMARYTTDFIGACGFGIDTDSLSDDSSAFRKLGKRIFTVSYRDAIAIILKRIIPIIFKHLHMMDPSIENQMVYLVKKIMEERNYKPCGRNDFIDLLLELKLKGKLVGDSIEKLDKDGKPKIIELEFDDLLLAAQVFIFFAAGFETSSSATSYTLHQLAFNPEAQKKCQAEIDYIIAKHKTLTYEAVKEMKYLEMAFKEGMRMFPSLGYLLRRCVKPYQIPGTDVVIDEGVNICIPLQALQNDPEYFESPELFQPERFLADNFGEMHKRIYLPFGEGPRMCIGERLGLMQSLAGLAAILHKFDVTPSKNTFRYPIIDPKSNVVQSISGGLPLSLTLRNNA